MDYLFIQIRTNKKSIFSLFVIQKLINRLNKLNQKTISIQTYSFVIARVVLNRGILSVHDNSLVVT